MQGLEHIEDLFIGFILALLDRFGDEFIEGRFLQLAFLQKLFKKTVTARLRLDATVGVAPNGECLLSKNGVLDHLGIQGHQRPPGLARLVRESRHVGPLLRRAFITSLEERREDDWRVFCHDGLSERLCVDPVQQRVFSIARKSKVWERRLMPHARCLSRRRELICAIRIGPSENSPTSAFRVRPRK